MFLVDIVSGIDWHVACPHLTSWHPNRLLYDNNHLLISLPLLPSLLGFESRANALLKFEWDAELSEMIFADVLATFFAKVQQPVDSMQINIRRLLGHPGMIEVHVSSFSPLPWMVWPPALLLLSWSAPEVSLGRSNSDNITERFGTFFQDVLEANHFLLWRRTTSWSAVLCGRCSLKLSSAKTNPGLPILPIA